MRVRITKRKDGAGVLHCVRADGSETWQRQDRRHAAHFSLHDLTHYAVETVLGYRRGFYGLMAEGWDVDDTTGKGSRGALPPEAIEVEHIVGLFDTERGAGMMWTAEEFNSSLAAQLGEDVRRLSEAEIMAVRSRRGELFQRWFAAPEGGALEFDFPGTAGARQA